jgi:type IV pilus assembly protein PilV
MFINMKQNKVNNFRRQLGFTLLEVLVAMLIMAIGVLGITALQFKGLKYNTDANFRSQISILAYAIADRMRLNRSNAASYVGDYTLTTTAPTGCNNTTAADATNDLACWRSQVFNALPPTSTANITASGNFYTVTLAWSDREGDSHSIGYTFQP